MDQRLQNYYKQFRSGYLSESNLSTKMEEVINWLLNQINDETKVKLQQYAPDLIQEMEQKILKTNEFRHYGHYRDCQNSIRDCRHLLKIIKNTLKTIDYYENTHATYAKIESHILIHSSIQLSTTKLFGQYLDKALKAITDRKLENAKLFLNTCAGDLESTLTMDAINNSKVQQLTERTNHYVQQMQATKDWAKYVPDSLDIQVLEKILMAIQTFIAEQKYVLVERLLDDLLAQLAPRIIFLETWNQYQELFPTEIKHLKTHLIIRLQQTAWKGGTYFLQEKMSSMIKTNIQNISLL